MKQKRSISIILGLTLMTLATQAQSSEEQQALAQFRMLFAHHQASYGAISGAQDGRQYVSYEETEHISKLTTIPGGWRRDRFDIKPDSVRFDVKRTDSLVSPLVATVTFTIIHQYTREHGTEQEARDGQLSKSSTSLSQHSHTFAWQGGRWLPAQRRHRADGGLLASEWSDCEDPKTRPEEDHGPKTWERDPSGCLEEFD